MDLKEKLDIIWKYSILVIILFSLICFHSNNKSCYTGHGCIAISDQCEMHGGHRCMMGDKKIKVEKKIIDGDTTVVVWVNGEKIDNPEAFLAKHKYDPDMKCCEKDGKKKVKIIKKVESD